MTLHLRATLLPSGETRDLFVVDGRLTFDGAVTGAGDARTILDGGFLLPGLVDAHAHLAFRSPAPEEASDRERAEASARAHLAEGVLAVREPGGPNRASTGLGPAIGVPRTFTAGRWLAGAGRYLPDLAREVPADELPDAAVAELQAANGWAKVIGDWGDPQGRWVPTFDADVLVETVRRVHAAGGRLAVHAIFPEAADAAIQAGADSLEHGSFLTDEQVGTMASRGMAWVPTVVAMRSVVDAPPSVGIPGDVRERLGRALSSLGPTLRTAAEAGVRILAGTDAALPHGMVRDEVSALVEAGLPPERAVAGASWEGRAYLGLPGLEEGAPADLVAFARDPREDLEALGRPSLIMLESRVIRPGPA